MLVESGSDDSDSVGNDDDEFVECDDDGGARDTSRIVYSAGHLGGGCVCVLLRSDMGREPCY